jgi:thymidylate synthase (FAD)
MVMEAAAAITEAEAWTHIPEGATPLLDHGFFQVKEVMGNDHEICESARMSYGRGTKKGSTDEQLIRYLLLNHHTSPFEMGEIKAHMRMPIFVMRQLVRHRTANLNEYSGRYSEMPRLFYIPDTDHICHQDKVNKQGSAEPLDPVSAHIARGKMLKISNEAFDKYEDLLKMGVSRETARMVLPLNTYTEVVWKIDVNNLIKLLMLRDDDHAQWEIRVYAAELAKALKQYFPLTYDTYELIKNSVTLTIPQLLAVVTNNPERHGLGKGEIAKVKKVLAFLMQNLVKPE